MVRRVAFVALVGVAGLLGLGALLEGCPRPDFASAAAPAGEAEARVPLPILVTPHIDAENGNALEAAFVALVGPGRAEVTFVWRDEDHPIPPGDLLYDAYRWRHWGRVADVETIEVHFDPARVDAHGRHPLVAVRFPGTYAGEQRWSVLAAEHHRAYLEREAFEIEGGRPVLHVATWNHLLHERDPNADLAKRRDATYPIYKGDRAAVEALFRAAREGSATEPGEP